MGGGEILKKGWLIKSPPLEGSSIKSWRKRWFCLRSSKVLEYYKSEDGDLKGVVNLEDCKAVNSDLYHKKYKFVFNVETKDRTYFLVASTREEMTDWVEAVCKACSFTSHLLGTSPPHREVSTLPVKSSSSQSNTRIPLNERFRPTENGSTSESLYSLAQSASHEVHRQLSRDQEVPAGTPLAEALASKGMGSGQRSTSVSSRTSGTSIGDTASSRSSGCMSGDMNYFTPRPADSPGYLVTLDPHATYSHPPNNSPKGRNGPFMSPPVPKPRSHTLMPNLPVYTGNNSPPGGGGGLGSRSFTNAPSFTDNGAEILSNGYMKPRPTPDRLPDYDYPPLGPPRRANVGDTSPRHHRSALLKQQGASPPSVPDREDTPPGDDPHTYMNLETLAGVLPPPIDRSTKPPQPVPPRINRGLKPGRNKGEDEWDFQSESPPDLLTHSDSMSEAIVGSYADEGVFGEADIPKRTSRSMHYTQIEFDPATRRPIPLPRGQNIQPSRGPTKPAGRRVNYADVDLQATQALAQGHKPLQGMVSLREAEQDALAEKYYVNLDKLGSIDDETNPGYYIHMRNFTFDEADKPAYYYSQHQPHQLQGASDEEPDQLYQAPRET